MNKLTVFIEDNKKELYLESCINKQNRTVMVLKNATVYWNFKNAGGYILSGTNKIPFEENYWTFAKIKNGLQQTILNWNWLQQNAKFIRKRT